MSELYSIYDTAKIFGLTPARLRYWAQTGFINPSVRRGGRWYYTFQDLINLRAAKELLDAGVSTQRVRESLNALRALLPDVAEPASKLRLCSDGETILAIDQDVVFEPTTGQVVMDFSLASLSREVAEILALPTTAYAPEVPVIDLAEYRSDSGEAANGEMWANASSEPGDEDDEDDEDYEYDIYDDRTGHGDESGSAGAFVEAANLPGAGSAKVIAFAPLSTGNEAPQPRPSTRPAPAALATAPEHALDQDRDLSAPVAVEDEPTAAHTPLSPYRCFLQGCEAEDRGDLLTAELAYRQALDLQPTLAAAHTNLGNLIYRSGDVAGARTEYERALELEPNQPEARFNLGSVLEDMGETELAIAELKRVCWSHPDFADAHYNLALLLARMGGGAQARVHLRRYIELDRESEWSEQAHELLEALG